MVESCLRTASIASTLFAPSTGVSAAAHTKKKPGAPKRPGLFLRPDFGVVQLMGIRESLPLLRLQNRPWVEISRAHASGQAELIRDLTEPARWSAPVLFLKRKTEFTWIASGGVLHERLPGSARNLTQKRRTRRCAANQRLSADRKRFTLRKIRNRRSQISLISDRNSDGQRSWILSGSRIVYNPNIGASGSIHAVCGKSPAPVLC